MELKVFRDTLSTMGSLWETKAELPIETELLIPDYLPQVFKIVKCFVYPVTLQKQVTPGRLTVEDLLIDTVYEPSLLKKRLRGHDPHLDRVSCGLFFHGREGRVAFIRNAPDPADTPGVADTLVYYSVGDEICRGAQPYVMRTYLVSDSREELDALSDAITGAFDVRDGESRSLLLHNERMSYDRASQCGETR